MEARRRVSSHTYMHTGSCIRGSAVRGSGLGVRGSGLGVRGSRFGVHGSGFGFEVWGLGDGVQTSKP